MRILDKIPYKLYFLIFGWLCLGELLSLFSPETDTYIYYHTLLTLYPPSWVNYALAILRTGVNVLCLLPLFSYAFNKRPYWAQFFKFLLAVRILSDLTGHNYEWQLVKAMSHNGTFVPITIIGIWMGIFFWSYKAHLSYCFNADLKLKDNQ